jgi:hypothetical protein
MGIKIPVDFSDVPDRGDIRVPEGDYVLKIVDVKRGESSNKKTPGLWVTFEIVSGPDASLNGKKIKDTHYLTKNALWTLRNMMEAMGYNVPAKEMKLDVDKMLMKRKVGAKVVDGEEYNNRIRSEIGDYIPVSAVNNNVSAKQAEDEDEEDGLDMFASDDEDDEDDDFPPQPEEDDDEDSEGLAFDDDEDDDDEDSDEEEVELSFDASDLEEAKGEDLKKYLTEAKEAGFEFDLGKKAKVADVREALLNLFEDSDDEEDEMEDFDLEDIE